MFMEITSYRWSLTSANKNSSTQCESQWDTVDLSELDYDEEADCEKPAYQVSKNVPHNNLTSLDSEQVMNSPALPDL